MVYGVIYGFNDVAYMCSNIAFGKKSPKLYGHYRNYIKCNWNCSPDTNWLHNEKEKYKIRNFVERIYKKEFVFDKYPAPRSVELINRAMDLSQKESNLKLVTDFVRKWGLDNSIRPKELEKLIDKHHYGKEDLDNQNEITDIMIKAKDDYKEIATYEIKVLSWIKYRKEFRKAVYILADEIKKMD